MSQNRTLIFVCLVSLVSSALLARMWTQASLGRVAPEELEPFALREPGQLETWTGSLDLGEGERVEFRLAPVRTDPSGGELDREVFAGFGLGPGTAFRLDVEHRGGAGAAPLTLGPVDVVDTEGRACAPPAAADLPAPFAGRFAVLADSLPPGSAVDLWLWGRAPRAGARVRVPRPGADPLWVELTSQWVSEREIARGSRRP